MVIKIKKIMQGKNVLVYIFIYIYVLSSEVGVRLFP